MKTSLYTVILLIHCDTVALSEPIDFVRDVRPVLQRHCYKCHGVKLQKSGLRLDIKSQAFRGGNGYGASVVPGNAKDSPLIQAIRGSDEVERMPPKGKPLTAEEIQILTRWVTEGAKWPDGVDLAEFDDRRDHWSFKPVRSGDVPTTVDKFWSRNEIDRFILARLEHEELPPALESDRVTWLRRVSFDLTGLPPDPEQVTAFVNDKRDDAYERVVDDMLRSQRHGERWAQHWLDVVRYAETHGFEVNTERPNAWPYRDYVIEAFNRDTPYDQFIREQIVGDQLKKDAATGFLVTASVLLPGQIGKDAPSIRLARQDAIDEIVVNIGQTFLGLSVGCARCHDHKFDPISQKDYYSMQAFVAGVEYGDRPFRSEQSEIMRQQARQATARIAAIDRRLAEFAPLAQVNSKPPRQTDARMNEETFSPLAAKYVRFTIHHANLHPTHGLIEPCVDEFEIFTDEKELRNVALASAGTKVTASGSRESGNHKLIHINDGKYGNSRSWRADKKGRGWVLFELPTETRIGKIVWSRDRQGQYKDRLATAYTIEAGTSLDKMTTITNVSPLRPPVNARVNIDGFAPIKAKRLRFTILKTMNDNRREPCIDELEVFNTAGDNIALATAGATVDSSGDNVEANRHELRFINDGNYGNSRSWMANRHGRSWVMLEFDRAQVIDRVVWGRDREGKFNDRLAIDYQIEVADVSEKWRTVANANDRAKFVPKQNRSVEFSLAGLSTEDTREADQLLDEKNKLQTHIANQSKSLVVFAGKFRKPDTIHLLRRGDPEQPQEQVVPATLKAIASLKLQQDSPEPHRRRMLANWIANPNNPLPARVMVNRIWQGHFGTGFVTTPNDFGRNGAKPSHPELLDWLAAEFIRSKWSIKHMHRLIVLSATYRQSSRHNALGGAKDTGIRLLWRYPTRRLEGEAIRDSMLAVSGRLNLKMGGRGFDLFDKRGGLTGFKPVESFPESGLRRMIYAHKVRRERDAVFGAFDCPDAGQSAARRRESTTPIQALNLLNSRFTLDQSDAFSARVQRDAGDDITKQIRRVWQSALSREPNAEEIRDAETVVREHGLSTLCRAVFNTNEFLFLP